MVPTINYRNSVPKFFPENGTNFRFYNSSTKTASEKWYQIQLLTIQVPKPLSKSGTKSGSLQFKYQTPFRRVVPNPVLYNSSTKTAFEKWYQIQFYTIQVPKALPASGTKSGSIQFKYQNRSQVTEQAPEQAPKTPQIRKP